MIRRPETDYTANIAGSAWVIGLVTWYFGASDALDRTLEPMRLFTAAGILSLVAGLVDLAVHHRRGKGALANALFLTGGLMLLGHNLAALVNRYADSSRALPAYAVVLSFQQPSKGPRTVTLELDGQRVKLQATRAEGCVVGNQTTLQLRRGALGARWLDSLSCGEPR